MQELARMESKGTMTSLQLVEVINNERAKIDNKKLLRHDVLLCIIRDEFTDELGVQNILESSYLNSQNKRLPMFELTLSQCKQVLVRESKNVRRKVIARLEELESKTPIPQTYLEALKALVVSEEQKQLAIADNTKLHKHIEETKPLVVFAESVQVSRTNILVGELAKLIKQSTGADLGQQRMFVWLRDNGYLHKGGEQYNLPTQKSVDMNLIKIKEGSRIDHNGVSHLTRTPVVTGKGQVYFLNKIKNEVENEH